MPHLFVNRLRHHSIGGAPDDLRNQFKWELVNAMCYLTGGIIFIAGSVMFLPRYEEWAALGCWLFVIGSFFYLFVACHDLYEVIHTTTATKQETKAKKTVDALAASAYIAGGLVFIIGSYQFLPTVEMYTEGSYNFIIGSLLFIGGAVTNSVQIFDSPTAESAMYANFTAVCYVIGSTLFLSGSVPYLMDFESYHDKIQIHRYLGVQFVLGSALFLIGGTINVWRAFLIFRYFLHKAKDEFQSKHAFCPAAEYQRSSMVSLPPALPSPRGVAS